MRVLLCLLLVQCGHWDLTRVSTAQGSLRLYSSKRPKRGPKRHEDSFELPRSDSFDRRDVAEVDVRTRFGADFGEIRPGISGVMWQAPCTRQADR